MIAFAPAWFIVLRPVGFTRTRIVVAPPFCPNTIPPKLPRSPSTKAPLLAVAMAFTPFS
jgi:hypothetical protein